MEIGDLFVDQGFVWFPEGFDERSTVEDADFYFEPLLFVVGAPHGNPIQLSRETWP